MAESDKSKNQNTGSNRINRISVVDQVCTSIKQDIVDGKWQPGDRLPSEAELAAGFGVNRLSVRMALQKLSTLGIIETRVGEGSFVCKFSLRPLVNEIAVFYEGENAFRDVQQLRRMLDYNSVILAINTATAEDKEALKKALDKYNYCAREYLMDVDNDELLYNVVESDFNFHFTVIKMTHNRIFMDIYRMAQELIWDNISELISARCHRNKEAGFPPLVTNEGHETIYKCIVNNDIEPLHTAIDSILGITPVPNLDFF